MATKVTKRGAIKRLRKMFKDTHWAKGSFATIAYPETGSPKLQFCLIGGLRVVQHAYETAIPENLVAPGGSSGWLNFKKLKGVARNPDREADRDVLVAVAMAISERHRDFRPVVASSVAAASSNPINTIIHFNDSSYTTVDDVVAVLTRADEILKERNADGPLELVTA